MTVSSVYTVPAQLIQCRASTVQKYAYCICSVPIIVYATVYIDVYMCIDVFINVYM